METEQTVYELVKKAKLLPLYTATDLTYLPLLEDILVDQLPLIEVTFRSPLAAEAIHQLAAGRLTVGAGTVRSLKEARIAVENGAKFIVSPAIVPEVIDYCLDQGIPIFPGVATPSDIQRATEYGLKRVKFFPADIYGGIKAIKALSGPFYDISFLPTGGIDRRNIMDYLAQDQVMAVGGSFIISEKALIEDEQKTRQSLAELIQLVRGQS